jgi:hypothetical protein
MTQRGARLSLRIDAADWWVMLRGLSWLADQDGRIHKDDVARADKLAQRIIELLDKHKITISSLEATQSKSPKLPPPSKPEPLPPLNITHSTKGDDR